MHSVSDMSRRIEAYSRVEPLGVAKPLSEVQASLFTSHTPSVVDAVSTQLFDRLPPERHIDPASIQLAERLAQQYQSNYGALQKEHGYEVAKRAFVATSGQKVGNMRSVGLAAQQFLFGWSARSQYATMNDQLQKNREATAEEFVFLDNAITTLSTLDSKEREQFIADFKNRGIAFLYEGKDPYGAKALLREIIKLVLGIIEPYLPEMAKQLDVVKQIEGANRLSTTFQIFNKAVKDYRGHLHEKIACESVIRTLEPETGSTWSTVSGSSNALSAEELQATTELHQAEEELKVATAAGKQLLASLPAAVSPSLVQTYALYQMVSAGEIHPAQIEIWLLKQVNYLANLTIYGTQTANSANLRAARTVEVLTNDEIMRRSGFSITDLLIAEDDLDPEMVNVTFLSVEQAVPQAVQDIRDGYSSSELVKERFASIDQRKKAIDFLSKRQAAVADGKVNAPAFDPASQELLFQLKVMNLSPAVSVLDYLLKFEGGQKDFKKAEEQVANLTVLEKELEESLAIYATADRDYRKQLTALNGETTMSSSFVAAITEPLMGPQTKESLEIAIHENSKIMAGCARVLQEAKLHQQTWQGMIDYCHENPSFMERMVKYKQMEQQDEEKRQTRIAEQKVRIAADRQIEEYSFIEMLPMSLLPNNNNAEHVQSLDSHQPNLVLENSIFKDVDSDNEKEK